MGIRNGILRAVGGSILSLAVAAGNASAQTTEIVPGGAADATFTVEPPKSISLGGTADYTITIQNGTSGHVTDLTLDSVALPAAPDGVSALKVASVSGCTPPSGAADPVPCTIAADLAVAGAQTVTVTVEWTTPETALTACPAGTGALGDVTFNFKATSTPGTFTAVGPGAGIKVDDQVADLAVALEQAPEQTSNGGTATFSGTITNNGPCPATNATASFTFGSLMSWETGTGDCTGETDECTFPTLAAGEVKTFSATYRFQPLPGDVASTLQSFEIDVAADETDLDSSNNTATSNGTNVYQSTSGCSSGGSGSLFALALLAAAVFGIRRRRTA